MSDAALRNVPPQQQTVFEFDGKVYRIPALFYERESKTLLTFAEQRTTVDDCDTEWLVMKRGILKEDSSNARTVEWSELKLVKEAHIHGHRPMNPCPVYDQSSKTLFLFFICVEGKVSEQTQITQKTNKARLCYITSNNLGQIWSEVTDLTMELPEIKTWATFAVGPGHGLQTEGGRLIVPVYAYTCPSSSKSNDIAPYALSLHSDDSGKSWQIGKMFQTESVECVMAEFFNDRDKSIIYCNARHKGGCRVEALSSDDGHSFTVLDTQKLKETLTGCQGSVVSFPAQNEHASREGDPSKRKNEWLLFTHPTESRRIKLGVYLNKSPLDSTAWHKAWIINKGPSGYSDLAYLDDGWFACVMECGEKKETEQIAFVVFNYNTVEEGIEEVKDKCCISTWCRAL